MSFTAAAALIAGATGWWTARTYRASLQDTVMVSAERNADLIQRSAHRAMLTNSREDLAFLVRSLGSQPEGGRVRIGNAEGRIAFSSEATEIGAQGEPPIARVRYFRNPPGLALIRPIRNEAECSSAACHAHPASQLVLGVLDVQMPLDRVEATTATFERRSLALGVLGVLLIAGLALPMVRMQLAIARRENERWTRELERRVEEKADELTRAYRQAGNAEKLASLGTLSAALAHELNNPLAGIRTYARWLSRTIANATSGAASGVTSGVTSEDRSQAWRQALDVIEAESKRCGDLVRNLLTFARQTPLAMAPADVVEIVERCLLLVRHQAEMQGIDVAWTPPHDLPPVVCDAAQVQQALLAILINGTEALPRGGVLRISAAAQAVASGKEVVVEIADNGPGIAPEVLPHLFEPFFTTKQAEKGTGLGLSLAHGIISRHGGRIEVDSGPGRGAKFSVLLPAFSGKTAALEPAA